MMEPEDITRSPLPEGVERPCADCNGRAIWLDAPAPNGARILISHDDGCPAYPALRAAQGRAL